MKNWLKRIIKKNRLKLYYQYLRSDNTHYFEEIDKEDKKVIVGLAADYSNLGDVAITYAQSEFLKNVYPNHKIVDFPISQTFEQMKELKTLVNNNDIITLVGGGNTGDHYDSTEYARQFFIKHFPENTIVSFPQTIDFSDTKKGNHLLKVAQKTYANHKKLILMAREEKSFSLYKELFPSVQVWLYPDIVLYLNESQPKSKRTGITMTLRTDAEKNIAAKDQEEMVELVKDKFNDVEFYDTDIKQNNLSLETRNIELNKIWQKFRESEVVVTDRLHGMIFCAITETPCVAINNSNKKVSRVYNKWLRDYSFIHMLEYFDTNIIIKEINILKNKQETKYDSNLVTDKFEELKHQLRKFVSSL